MKNLFQIVFFCFSLIITEIKSNEIFQSNILAQDLVHIQSPTPPLIKYGNFSLSGFQTKTEIVPSVSSILETKIYKNNEKLNSKNFSLFDVANGSSNSAISNMQFAEQSRKIISSGFIQSLGGFHQY